MLKKILVILLVLLIVFAVVAAMQPNEFSVTRTVTMAAPPEKIFNQVNDLHAWDAWSPWAKLDPEAKESFEGPAAGVGAIMRWDGNMKVGKGSMTITESRPNEAVKFALEFERPLPGTNTAEFAIRPEGDQTAVTWSMQGKPNFLAKAMGLIFNCEKMVGDQFETGLANLKAVVEPPK